MLWQKMWKKSGNHLYQIVVLHFAKMPIVLLELRGDFENYGGDWGLFKEVI